MYLDASVAAMPDSIFDWLAWRSGENPLTTDEQVVFYTQFSLFVKPLEDRWLLSIKESRSLVVMQVKNALKSQATAVMFRNGFVFDGGNAQTGVWWQGIAV